jgi:adenylate cyclase
MDDRDIDRIGAWVVGRGLAGASETELLDGFCERCCAAGLALSRSLALIDTLHPVYEGRGFRWRADGSETERVIEYRPTNQGENAANWQKSAFYQLWTSGEDELRRRIGHGDRVDFLYLEAMRDEGERDFLALAHRFARAGVIGEMDCFFSHWTTQCATGFSDPDVAALRRLVPSLGLAIKCASLARIAGTLVEVYLGRDAGRRVLSGRIARGVADRIRAVLWFSDLQGYTTITDTAEADEIIPLLNDYADAVISAIHDAGGDVLKLIGDGVLAIFTAEDSGDACRAALRAEAKLRQRIRALNERRTAEGRPVTSVYLGLHIGDVFYGNIGSDARLDFTVVGPAVNEVSRIASMCQSVGRGVVLSSDFAGAAPAAERAKLVSVGRFALRGVGRSQELFTLDPDLLSPR